MFLKRSEYEFMVRRLKNLEERLDELQYRYDRLELLIEREADHFTSAYKKMLEDHCKAHNLRVFKRIGR